MASLIEKFGGVEEEPEVPSRSPVFLTKVRALLPDWGDIHVYGGIALVALGARSLIVLGVLLLALGLVLTKPWR